MDSSGPTISARLIAQFNLRQAQQATINPATVYRVLTGTLPERYVKELAQTISTPTEAHL